MQPVIPAFPATGCGVGNVLSAVRPAYIITLTFHEGDELLPALGVLHALVNGVHQLKFDALSLRR